MAFPFTHQLDQMNCGPACLHMIATYYGKKHSLQYIRENCHLTKTGVSMFGIVEGAEKIGLKTVAAKINYDKLKEIPLPCIVHWNQNHFVVVYNVKGDTVYIADPGHGLVKISKEVFLKSWLGTSDELGIVLLFEPTPEFHSQQEIIEEKKTFSYFLNYLRPYKSMIVQLLLGLVVASIFDLLMPFLTQSLVDYGINFQNLNFIYVVLVAQVVIFFSRMAVELIRSRILLHLGSRINIAIISDYLYKLLSLPIPFFDSKLLGDFTQRINDHKRIESFLTEQTLSIIFSLFSLIIFSVILAWYSWKVLLVFMIGSILSVLWIIIFQKKRKQLDYLNFNRAAENQSNMYELIKGIDEIKLGNLQIQKRWQWQKLQARLYAIRFKALNLAQMQAIGNSSINRFKNILITFIAALEVINGSISLGMMMAITYIVGQLNSPIDRLLDFIRTTQDAKISFERLSEVNEQAPEDDPNLSLLESVPANSDIIIQNLSFGYEGPNGVQVLNNLNCTIPNGKTTAIVGASGSGKTTLLKLLLKFYSPTKGDIYIGNHKLTNINAQCWRNQIGAVMQDGYIFTDTITKNIIGSAEKIDGQKLDEAVHIANISMLINKLPMGFTTKIGSGGDGLSSGQKQRLLIARAVYKNPDYIFFDEATSALDANNEKVIIDNLSKFCKNKTVIVIAHRLSTVKNADQIIVLDDGKIVESGNHESLTASRGKYFDLVKNQLELGN